MPGDASSDEAVKELFNVILKGIVIRYKVSRFFLLYCFMFQLNCYSLPLSRDKQLVPRQHNHMGAQEV